MHDRQSKPWHFKDDSVTHPQGDLIETDYLNRAFSNQHWYLSSPRSKSRTTVTPAPSPAPSAFKRTKLFGLAMAALMFTGAIVGAFSVQQYKASQPYKDLEMAAPAITGTAALSGFVLHDRPKAAQRQKPASSASATKNKSVVHPTPTTDATTSNSGHNDSSNPKTVPPKRSVPAKKAVTNLAAKRMVTARSFYTTMDRDPQSALSLLDPLLVRGHGSPLVSAWGFITRITVQDIQITADDLVRTVVVIHQSDGTRLRITQLLSFAQGTATKIKDARLLSAEYF